MNPSLQKPTMRKSIQSLKATQWGNTPQTKVNLKWGENPYPPSPKIIEAIKENLSKINQDPSPTKEPLISALIYYTKQPKENILITNGSDKAFRLIAETFIELDDEAIICTPTFPVMASAVRVMGGIVVSVPLTEKFEATINTIIKQTTQKTKLIYLCNPNNPTGNITINRKQLKKLLSRSPQTIIIIDEAYYEFCDTTYADLIKTYPNLIILRSFSKTFSLAGMRVGYILSNKKNIQPMRAIEESIEVFNTSTLSLVAATEALNNIDYQKKTRKKIETTREKLRQALTNIDLSSPPSRAPFLLLNIQSTGLTSTEFTQSLAATVLVKDCAVYDGLPPYFVRIGIPLEKDLEFTIAAIQKLCTSKLCTSVQKYTPYK